MGHILLARAGSIHSSAPSTAVLQKWYILEWWFRTSLVSIDCKEWWWLTREQAKTTLKKVLTFPWTMRVDVKAEGQSKSFYPNWRSEEWWQREQEFAAKMAKEYSTRQEQEEAVRAMCESQSPFRRLKVSTREFIKDKVRQAEKDKLEVMLAEGAFGLWNARRYAEGVPYLQRHLDKLLGNKQQSTIEGGDDYGKGKH